MSKIKVTSKVEIYDGMSITFKAPCECTAVDGLTVCYKGMSQSFTLRDSHGNDLAGVRNLFSAGTYVKVILDTTSGVSYIQNADSNAYLENRLDAVLKDETRTLYGLEADAAPDTIFQLLASQSVQQTAYASDLYLYITGRHPILNADFMSAEAWLKIRYNLMKSSLARTISLTGDAQTITVYDGGGL